MLVPHVHHRHRLCCCFPEPLFRAHSQSVCTSSGMLLWRGQSARGLDRPRSADAQVLPLHHSMAPGALGFIPVINESPVWKPFTLPCVHRQTCPPSAATSQHLLIFLFMIWVLKPLKHNWKQVWFLSSLCDWLYAQRLDKGLLNSGTYSIEGVVDESCAGFTARWECWGADPCKQDDERTHNKSDISFWKHHFTVEHTLIKHQRNNSKWARQEFFNKPCRADWPVWQEVHAVSTGFICTDTAVKYCGVYFVAGLGPTPRFQRDKTVSGPDWWLRCRCK